MCGIAGVIGPRISPDRISVALASMHHRGPDASGAVHHTIGEFQATLLHTRLAILDLDGRSNQPFEHAHCALTFNGEIYNYRELRSDLEALGNRFETSGDTEVVMRAYLQWGPDATGRLEGMWALALVDRRQGHLWLSRDRFGEKPLFTWLHNGAFYFASEVKTIAALAGQWPDIDHTQVRRYLVNGYRALFKHQSTFFETLTELPSGTSAILTRPSQPKPRLYWSPCFAPQRMTRAEAVGGARERLLHAVELRLRADVPLAFCLSGGVDSTALTAIAARNLGADTHAFSIIDSDERYDESRNIAATVRALDCKHTAIHTSTAGFGDRIRRLVSDHDAPVATVSYYVHSFLSEAISDCGFKVAVSGTAADELFTGYYDHYGYWLSAMAGRCNLKPLLDEWRSGYGTYVRNPLLRDPNRFIEDPSNRDHLFPDRSTFNELLVEPLDEGFAEEGYADEVLRNRMMNELLHEVVPVILREDDLNSMRVSVENRSPFLDRELVEFMYKVPVEHLIHGGFAKSILRDAVSNLVPAAIVKDKRKRGFNASMLSLIDPADRKTREHLLDNSQFFDIVKRSAVERVLDGNLADSTMSKCLFGLMSAKCFVDEQKARRTISTPQPTTAHA